mgnify:CR=1 FL=1
MSKPIFRPTDQAFDAAIAQGRLSTDAGAENYAGHYMYMGDWPQGKFRLASGHQISEFRAQFKHRDTRQYIA